MVFALATDERTLFVFASQQQAISHCEGIDVEDGVWRFWDQHGAPLHAQFSQPNHRSGFSVGNGIYHLVPNADGERLAVALARVAQLETNEFFSSLSRVQEHLALARHDV